MHDVIIDDTRTSVAASVGKKVQTSKPKKKRSFSIYLLDWVEKALIISCLISIDFVTFAGAGSYKMFDSFTFLAPEIWYIISGIFILSILLMYILSFSSFIQNIVVSAVATLFVIVMLNQFAAFDKNSMLASLAATYVSQDLGLLFNYVSHIVISVVIGILFFLFVSIASKKTIAWFVLFLALMLLGIVFSRFTNEKGAAKYNIVKEDVRTVSGQPGKRFIYIGLPTVGSYNYLNDVAQELHKNQNEYENLRKTLDIMLGFYAKNNFILYPHAYVNEINPNNNWGQTLNANSSKNSFEYTLKNITVDKFWKFDYLTQKSMFLKENKIYDTFKKAKFGINAYQSGGVEMCKVDNEMVVNRCVEKNGLPIDFDGMNISQDKKIEVLLAQWLESTGLFDDFSFSYNLMRPFVDVETFPMIGISYQNINAKNSLDVLDMLIQDVEKDTGNKAYFVNLNLPGNTFIYDEFCKIKPIEKWQNKNDLPWVKKISDQNKRNAYSDQLRCVFGALEKFMERLEKSDVGKNSVVVIQGMSGINGMTPLAERNFINELKNKKYVDMAIKDPLKNKFKVEYDVCSAPNILKQYLYRQDKCQELKEFNLHVDSAKDLINSLHNLTVSDELVTASQESFDKWYAQWLDAQSGGVIKANLVLQKNQDVEKKEIQAPKNAESGNKGIAEGVEGVLLAVDDVVVEKTEAEVEQINDAVEEKEIKQIKTMDNVIKDQPEVKTKKMEAKIEAKDVLIAKPIVNQSVEEELPVEPKAVNDNIPIENGAKKAE